jgi:hypothetical protein
VNASDAVARCTGLHRGELSRIRRWGSRRRQTTYAVVLAIAHSMPRQKSTVSPLDGVVWSAPACKVLVDVTVGLAIRAGLRSRITYRPAISATSNMFQELDRIRTEKRPGEIPRPSLH